MLKITSDHGHVEVSANGSIPEIMADLTAAIGNVVDAVVDNSDLPRDVIVRSLAGGLSIANGYVSPEEAIGLVTSKEA